MKKKRITDKGEALQWLKVRTERGKDVNAMMRIFKRHAKSPEAETLSLLEMLRKNTKAKVSVLLIAEPTFEDIPILYWHTDSDKISNAVLGLRHGSLPEEFDDERFLILGIHLANKRFTFGVSETDALGALQFSALMPEPSWWRNLKFSRNSSAASTEME